MPQFDTSVFPSQIFWLIVTFAILYWIMSRVALPRVGEVLEAREHRISNDLDRASALRAEAEEIMAAYEKALAEARARAAEVTRQTEASAARESAERQARLAADLAAKIRAAEDRISAAKAQAMRNLQGVASDVARATVERLIGVNVSPAEAEQAAASALASGRRG